MRNRDETNKQDDAAAEEGYGSAELYGRDILAATLLASSLK